MHKKQNHWYPRYVGDYAKKTAELSMVEHGAYALLLDHYYSTEKPLDANASVLHRVCRAFADEEREAVQTILDRFFVLMSDGYHNDRADQELSKRIDISDKRRSAANKKHYANAGANADTPTPTPTIPSNEGIDSVSDPPKSENRFDKWWGMFPKQRAGSKEKAKLAYAKAIKRATEDEIHEGTIRYNSSDEVARGYAKGAAAWLNDDRWTTQYRAANCGGDQGGGFTGQSRAGGNGREPRGVVAAALRVAARLEGKDQNDG